MTDESTAQEGVDAAEDVNEATEATAEETEAQDAATDADESEEEATSEDEEEGDGEEEEIAEEIEFDFGGNKMAVPKDAIPPELADKLDSFTKGLWSDYTRKSQDVSERAKSLEVREQAVEKLQNLSQDAQVTYARGLHLKSELEQLQGIDLSAMWQSNPDQARRVSDAISQKQAEFNSVLKELSEKESTFSKEQEAEVSRRMEEGKTLIEKRIPGFSAKASEVVDYAVKEYGLSKEEAEQWPLNPMTAEMAYKAMLYDKMQQAAKPKPVAKKQVEKPVKPMKSAGGKATRRPDLNRDADKMSPDEWLKQRNAQLRKRG